MAINAVFINDLAEHYEADSYLEIGASESELFAQVNISNKVLVDVPIKRNSDVKIAYYPHKNTNPNCFDSVEVGENKKFDIICINESHYFEDVLSVFESSLYYCHKNTIWIIDNTVPSDPYSSLTDYSDCLAFRKKSGIMGKSWHGDVYKVLFVIHDYFPNFSYCTIIDNGKSLSCLWQNIYDCKRKPFFCSFDNISNMNYFEMLKNGHLMMPISRESIYHIIGKLISPQNYNLVNAWKMLCYKKAITKKEKEQLAINKDLSKQLRKIENNKA